VRRTIWGSVFLALVLTAGLIGLALLVFNAGVAQGLARSGEITLPAAGSAAVGPGAWYAYPHAWGFGYGLLGCLVPFLLILLFFSALRHLFWHRRWGPGWGHAGWGHRRGYGRWEKGYPPFFDEWHRRAHGEPEPDEAEDANGS
jgi:hypothetical protein